MSGLGLSGLGLRSQSVLSGVFSCLISRTQKRITLSTRIRVEGIKRDARLTSVCLTSDVCLSVAYIGHKSRTERPRKTKICTEVARVTRDSDITFNVKRSKVNLQWLGHNVA